MRKGILTGTVAIATMLLFAGCSGSVEIGPVPTITPRPAVTLAPTPTPEVTVEQPGEGDAVETTSVYETKQFKEYYEKENKLPELDEAYKDLFIVGIDALVIDVTDEARQAVVKEQFNFISVKGDLSPNNIMDYETSKVATDKTRIALNFTGADVILKFAQENNIPVRGPRLITHEVPEWAFTKDLDRAQVTETTNEDGTVTKTIDYASPDVILARMENYIKDVITYCNTNYPGVVVSWDILDDPINSAEANDAKVRSNYWFQGIGEDYYVTACQLARKYATADQKLFLSQIDLHLVATQKPALVMINSLKDQKLIDGVAIQGHYNPNVPNVFDMDDMFKNLAATGLELHVTEFYVDTNTGDMGDFDLTPEELIARGVKRYKALMTNLVNYEQKKGYDIVSITFEGLSDDTSYLNEPKEYFDEVSGERMFGVKLESYPYLFDTEFKVKEAFFAALGDKSIKGY